MSLLLTNNASPGSSDGMMPVFLVEEGRGMEKLVIVAISLNLLTESLLDGWTRNSNDICLHVDIYQIFFSARCNIYISRLCHDASPSVRATCGRIISCHASQC